MPNTPIPPNDSWVGTGLMPPPLGVSRQDNTSGTSQQWSAEQKPKKSGIWGSIVAALVIGFKYIKIALSSGKFLLIGKTFLSMGVSIAAYAMMSGWAFAAIFIALLFVHEMGHVWAAKRIGLPVSAPLFIPFVGAAISMKRNPQSAAHEAYVAVGGPILGTLGCMVCFTIAWQMQSAFLFHMAFFGFALNLINLVPVSPLDGGRIVASVSPWLWLLGALIMVPLLIWMEAYIFLLIVVFISWPQFRKLFQGRDQQWKVYHTCTKRQRIYASGAWVSLVGLLGFSLLISGLGAKMPGDPRLGVGMLLAWLVSLIVGAICFFTWPLARTVGR